MSISSAQSESTPNGEKKMSPQAVPKPDFMEQEAWDNLMATRDAAIIRGISKEHVKRYLELDGGGDTFLTQGSPTLLLGMTGRKSGNEVIAPVNYMPKGDDVYVVGSIAGLDRHPALGPEPRRQSESLGTGEGEALAGRSSQAGGRGSRGDLAQPGRVLSPLGTLPEVLRSRVLGVRVVPRGRISVADEKDERMERAIATAMELFKPGSPVSAPKFEYPKEIAEDWNQFSMSTVMGDVWARPGLAKKDRALITIALLTALDKPQQLRAYVTGGLNLGLSREEICEAIMQVSVYAGFPSAIQGLGVANEVFLGIRRRF